MKLQQRFEFSRSSFVNSSYSMLWIAGALVLAMASICVATLYQSRLDTMAHAVETSRNLAIFAENDVARNIELYDLSLQAVVDGMNDPELMKGSPRLRAKALFDRAASATYLGSFVVLDTQGNVVLDARDEFPHSANFSTQDFFAVHKTNPNAGLYIGDPYPSKLHDGAMSIPLSRRITHPDGTFAGVAVLDVQLEYFKKLFSGLSLGANGSLALIRKDGLMMMRQPFDPKVIGRNIRNASTYKRFMSEPEGSFSDTSYLDGTKRLYYFRNPPGLPFIIMVARGQSDIYMSWWERTLIIASMMAVLSASFIVLARAFVFQLNQRIRAESELALLARTDGLTGLNNRRRFDEMLDQEWDRARRNQLIFSVLFVDIDRFKIYNDTYGHQAGDEVIAKVAKCISDSIRRPGDIAARYGGEEFIVALPNTDIEGASNIAETIRAAVFQLEIENVSSEFGCVTVSIGCAAWAPKYDADVAAVIHAADAALYDAKKKGRNMVAVRSVSSSEKFENYLQAIETPA